MKKGRNRTDSPTVSAALPPQENNIPPEPPATTVARLDRRAKQLGTSLEWFSPWDLARTGMASTGIATRKTSNTVVRTRATLCLLSETGKATKGGSRGHVRPQRYHLFTIRVTRSYLRNYSWPLLLSSPLMRVRKDSTCILLNPSVAVQPSAPLLGFGRDEGIF